MKNNCISSDFCARLSIWLWGSWKSRRHGQFFIASIERVVGDIASVEHIVLEHEEYIKGHRKEPQSELSWISEYWAPVVIVVGYQEHLQHAECSPGEVQEDVPNTPSQSTLEIDN